MNYMEQEQSAASDFSNQLIEHLGIMRRNIVTIIGLAIVGLLGGLYIQAYSTSTYVNEVLLKSSNGLYLNLFNNLIYPTTLFIRNDSIIDMESEILQTTGNQPGPNLKIKNGTSQRIVFGRSPTRFIPVDLKILLRAAKSKSGKIAAINSLPEASRLRKLGNLSEAEMSKVIRKFGISSLSRESDEIIVRFDGKSVTEATAAVDALVGNLRNQFSKVERDKIKTAFEGKLLVIDAQISERINVLEATLQSDELDDGIKNDVLLIAFNSDRRKIVEYPIDQISIEPFIVVPIDTSKKESFVSTWLWLAFSTLGGLFIGLILVYGLIAIRSLRATKAH